MLPSVSQPRRRRSGVGDRAGGGPGSDGGGGGRMVKTLGTSVVIASFFVYNKFVNPLKRVKSKHVHQRRSSSPRRATRSSRAGRSRKAPCCARSFATGCNRDTTSITTTRHPDGGPSLLDGPAPDLHRSGHGPPARHRAQESKPQHSSTTRHLPPLPTLLHPKLPTTSPRSRFA